MAEQTFSATRCRDTRKPREKECPDVSFYRCPECKALFPVTRGREKGAGTGEREILCCNRRSERLLPVPADEVGDDLKVTYRITGGYNDNAVRVSWRVKSQEYAPEWLYLKTFTGGYLKYVAEGKSSMVFALADTDAFAYCDEDPCLECVFRCKRGFVIYVYGNRTGLLEIPLDKMNAQWQSETLKR